jgi:transposase
MSKALSLDLRERVLAAVAQGASGRQAALRFGVSAASVSRWRDLARRQGNARPGPLGGDRRSKHIEAHAEAILRLVAAERDATLQELRSALAARGLVFGQGTLWRFFKRRGYTLKKRPGTPTNRPGPTS